MKKYNNQTGCYKIDIFLNGSYVCSTEQSRTCKIAKDKYAKFHSLGIFDKLTAHFSKFN